MIDAAVLDEAVGRFPMVLGQCAVAPAGDGWRLMIAEPHYRRIADEYRLIMAENAKRTRNGGK